MTLRDLLERLAAANIAVDVGQLLDTFWLATQRVDLSLQASASSATATPVRGQSTSAAPPREPTRLPSLKRWSGDDEEKPSNDVLEDSTLRLVFPRITSDEPTTLERPASPVVLPAPRALANRLAIMRALRPLTRRWPSRQYLDIDEEDTVEACARLWSHDPNLVVPVFRPRRERWFDVELVLEDNGAAPLWEDMLREFAAVLRETGAFGRVREWTMLVVGDGASRAATLENRQGVRASVRSLQGKAARRLVIFASNGSSPHWRDGAYAEVLVPWLRDSCTLLLQLTPPDRWARSGLGEPHATVSTTVAGALPPALRAQLHWWRMDDEYNEGEDGTRACDGITLPVSHLSASGLAQWADMQMARGRRSPAYRLRMPNKAVAPQGDGRGERHEEPSEAAVAQTLSLLKYESPSAFRLAVFLCASPFTLAVARLVQAVKFEGSTDPGMLDELLRSGIVVTSRRAFRPGARDGARDGWYAVRPHARELLLRSLRESDAQEIARELQRHVSRHLERLSGSGARSAQLIADEQGRHRLPPWAQPFADVATSLLGLPSSLREAQRKVREFLHLVQPRAAMAVTAIATMGGQPSPEALPPTTWEALRAARLIHEREDGQWIFAPYARDLLASLTPEESADEAADWLESGLRLLQSMALAFHVSAIVRGTGEQTTSIRDMLSDWPSERRAQLAHWMYMSEYIFWGPVREVLFTGEDPLHHADAQDGLDGFAKAAAEIAEWIDGDDNEAWRWRTALRGLWNAVRLALRRDPRLLEEAALPRTVQLLHAFAATPVEHLLDGQYERDQRIDLVEAVREPKVVNVLAIYFSPFFARFGTDGLSELAYSANYASYLDGLLSLWRDATVSALDRVPTDSTETWR